MGLRPLADGHSRRTTQQLLCGHRGEQTGTAGATVTFALREGSLPPGLTMPAQSGSGTVITGNPAKAGTYNFTVKATDGGLTATLPYQIRSPSRCKTRPTSCCALPLTGAT
jgi:hypothetical protein